MNDDTIEYLKSAAEYGPANPKFADTILGWETPNGHTICAKCAARILERGCHLPRGTEPIWKDGKSEIICGIH
jgi:hypothetical protein